MIRTLQESMATDSIRTALNDSVEYVRLEGNSLDDPILMVVSILLWRHNKCDVGITEVTEHSVEEVFPRYMIWIDHSDKVVILIMLVSP